MLKKKKQTKNKTKLNKTRQRKQETRKKKQQYTGDACLFCKEKN
jgi:hypothetical protein